MKRAYETPSPADGRRVLVERLWPRGLSKEKAAVDVWFKEVAPSTELRRWFGHDPAKWEEFRRRYREELRERPEELQSLRSLVEAGPVTFVYGSRDQEHNAATVLKELLESEGAGGAGREGHLSGRLDPDPTRSSRAR
ncbi:MAG TPA: DUF488 family protein [Candidatus Limnocylindrales bacterium]